MAYGSVSRSAASYYRFCYPSQLSTRQIDLVITSWNVTAAVNGRLQKKDQKINVKLYVNVEHDIRESLTQPRAG